MAIRQQRVPGGAFAQAVREEDPGFAERVAQFEARFGPVSEDLLGVLAQARYTCWFVSDYHCDLLNACRAIGSGRPCSFQLCGQVAPEQWQTLCADVVGLRRWLGEPVYGARLAGSAPVHQFLGEPTPAKEILARLLLRRLSGALLSASPSRLGPAGTFQASDYADPSAEWFETEGADVDVAAAECRRALASEGVAPADAVELVAGLVAEEQPCCMFRYARHVDVKMASIGALKWRGRALPEDPSKARWQAFTAAYGAAVRSWLEGLPPSGALGENVHAALGPSTERKEAMVTGFLLQPPDGAHSYGWCTRNMPTMAMLLRSQAGWNGRSSVPAPP